MPAWCPKCGAMLPDGLEKCPRCAAKLPKAPANPEAFTNREIFLLTLETFKIILLPIVLVLIVGLLCWLLFSLF